MSSDPISSLIPESVTQKPCAVVTGGTAGIGLATAKLLASQGYNLLICGRNEERLNDALDAIQNMADGPCSIVSVRCDLAVAGAGKQLAEIALQRLGKVDLLVNNAGMAPLSELENISDEVFESTLEVNVKSVFYLTRGIWKSMKGQGSGCIVNISSLAAIDPFPGFSLYGSTKAWVDLMTTALAAEGKEHGIRVYSIRPGAVETEMLRGLFPDFPADQCVTPEDIAAKIWQCVSQPDQHCSGEHYPVTKQPA